MSQLRLKAPGTTGSITSFAGAPQNYDRNNGFPTNDLLSLFLLTEGTIGAGVAGPWANSVPAGASATLLLGAQPTRQSYGLQLNADGDGGVLDSGRLFTASGTAIIAIKSDTPIPTNQYGAWFGPKYDFPGAKTGTFPTNAPRPIIYSNSGSDETDAHGMLDSAGANFGANVSPYISPAASVSPASSWNIVAFRYDNSANGFVDLSTLARWAKVTGNQPPYSEVITGFRKGMLGHTYRSHLGDKKVSPPAPATVTPALAAYWSFYVSGSYNAVFGLWPNSTLRPVNGRLGLFAYYGVAVTDDILREAMLAAGDIMVGRGIAPAGFTTALRAGA